jgi:hypothetical protein
MRWVASICALLIAASVGGCALIEAEKNNRGGFLDQAADDLWMKADSKKMRALRALALEASLARIAMIAPKSAPDRALLARRIGETSKRADVVRQCAFYPKTTVAGQRTDEPCFFFDSVMVDYENALFDLALIALPIDDAKNLISRVSGGIASVSINPLELVQTLVDIGREAFRYGRVVGAIYRDTLELEVQVWLASPQFADSERARGVSEEFIVTEERVAGLRAAYARGNDNIPTWRAHIAALRAEGLEPVPSQRFIVELYAILEYICGQIVSKQDDSYQQCVFRPTGVQDIPVVTSAGGRLFRTGAGTSTGTGQGREQQLSRELQEERKKREEAQRRADQLNKQQQRLALNDTERRMKPETLLSYKQALCVTSTDASSDIFDTQTRDRLREFVGGLAWSSASVQDGAQVVIDPTIEGKLKEAIKISPSCTKTSVARNAYELGVFARAGVAAAETEMQNALKFLKRSDARLFDTARGRDAIIQLRQKFQPQTQATTDAQLDPPLWGFVKKNSECNKLGALPELPGGGRVQSDCPAGGG